MSKKNFSFKFGLTCENGNDKQDYEVILEIAESDNPGTSEENHHPPIIDISGFNAQEGANLRIKNHDQYLLLLFIHYY